MIAIARIGLTILALWAPVTSAESVEANPIRKVVTLMQNMQKEVEEQGVKEKELFDKFMCYCEGSDGDLKQNVVATTGAIKALGSKIEQETAETKQLALELSQHAADKAGAEKDLAEATAMREKESSEAAANTAEIKTNLAAVSRAIPALEKGMGGAALMQLPGADRLANLLDTFTFRSPADRRHLLAFVQQTGDYVPASGQIVGILKGMSDEMQADIATAEKEEASSADAFAELKASKESEVQIATEAIAAKTGRSGELSVSVAQAKDELEDAEDELDATQALAAQLKTQCATKETEWAAREKVRADEISAISEAIAILNDDDALDTFKKAMPSPELVQRGLSLLQRSAGRASVLSRAQALLAGAARRAVSQPERLMLYTVRSKVRLVQKNGVEVKNFDAVIKLIDDMVALLDKNQQDDDTQKDFCREEFHKSEGEEAATTRELEAIKVGIEEQEDAISTLGTQIVDLTEGIKALDKSVALATEQRKEEHAEYVTTASLNQAAMGLVAKAKNRMAKFYSPTTYVAPPTTTESSSPYGFVQVSSQAARVAPLEAPAGFGEYKKGGASNSILTMMDQIIRDLENDSADGETDEKDAQKEYAAMMSDSQASRAEDAKSITDKEAAKAELEVKLEQSNEKRRTTEQELNLVKTYIRDLHSKCDFLMKNYDERKAARTQERDNLEKAKATLAGAR